MDGISQYSYDMLVVGEINVVHVMTSCPVDVIWGAYIWNSCCNRAQLNLDIPLFVSIHLQGCFADNKWVDVQYPQAPFPSPTVTPPTRMLPQPSSVIPWKLVDKLVFSRASVLQSCHVIVGANPINPFGERFCFGPCENGQMEFCNPPTTCHSTTPLLLHTRVIPEQSLIHQLQGDLIHRLQGDLIVLIPRVIGELTCAQILASTDPYFSDGGKINGEFWRNDADQLPSLT